jgi:hypothetical protein
MPMIGAGIHIVCLCNPDAILASQLCLDLHSKLRPRSIAQYHPHWHPRSKSLAPGFEQYTVEAWILEPWEQIPCKVLPITASRLRKPPLSWDFFPMYHASRGASKDCRVWARFGAMPQLLSSLYTKAKQVDRPVDICHSSSCSSNTSPSLSRIIANV